MIICYRCVQSCSEHHQGHVKNPASVEVYFVNEIWLSEKKSCHEHTRKKTGYIGSFIDLSELTTTLRNICHGYVNEANKDLRKFLIVCTRIFISSVIYIEHHI